MTSCKICKEVTLVGRQDEPTTQLIPATLTFIVLEGGRRATRCVSNAGQASLLSDGTCCQHAGTYMPFVLGPDDPVGESR